MAFQVKCADSGAKCDFEVKADTREEIMDHIQVHAKHAHPEMLKNPPPREAIEKLIRKV